MIYNKLTYGCVVQTVDSDTGDCMSVQFVPDGKIERQNEGGEPIGADDAVELENTEKECSLDMVQP